MPLHFNKLTFKGKSTADFPFDIYVTENDGINKAKRKDKIFTSDDMSGGVVRTSNAYELVEKPYKLLIHGVSLSETDGVLAWLEGSGKLVASNNPYRYYEVLTVSAIRSKLGEVDEYEIDVTFTCNPFSYSVDKDLKTYTSNGVLNNTSHVEMYPKVTVYGNTTEATTLTIGTQVIRLKEIKEKVVIECKQGHQNVFDKNGDLLNGVMLGPFFEVKPGENGISIGQRITKVDIECRWGAFA